MKRWAMLVAVYVVIRGTNGQDALRTYEGMTPAQVNAAISSEGKDFDFINKQQYEALIRAREPRTTEDEARKAAKDKARQDLKRSGASTDAKVAALILLLDLDQ